LAGEGVEGHGGGSPAGRGGCCAAACVGLFAVAMRLFGAVAPKFTAVRVALTCAPGQNGAR
jgi:hypothetical protein